jgi:hypothetical protein
MAKYNLYVEDVSVEAVFNKLGGVEGARRFLRDELTLSEVVRSWSEEDGIIRFSVTSNGTSGAGWVKRLADGGYNTIVHTMEVLLSSEFKPTKGVTTEIVVMKCSLFSSFNDRKMANIRTEAGGRKYVAPNHEAACLIREKFTDKEIEQMGLRGIIVMSKPIKSHLLGCLISLCVNRGGDGCFLGVSPVDSDNGLRDDFGVAFAVPQATSAVVF